ncbi:MAG TPA: iron-containing alcohol dehydrogenase [Desulfobacteraceae bacterium]|jgi:alcohol dehydrogenase class IV|nr:iron-containing alcohol dehydrogenase [Desulfobacteraceae bacterium]
MLSTRTFLVPPILITGSGSSDTVGKEIAKLGLNKGLLVTDGVLCKTEMLERIKSKLTENKIEFAIYDSINSEPTVDFVINGLEVFRKEACQFVLAVGGGSAIDTAKAICATATNEGSIADYKGLHRLPNRAAPLIAVPTTAGTGSEVTIFTIITDTKTDVKMLIGSPYLMPQVAIVDPLLTLSCPRELTAAVGIDALTHAIEAYVSLKAQPMSDLFALSAIELISGNLRQAWANGGNIKAREKTMMGALQAGIAFSNSSVALVHGMSRPIGAYFHVPHGMSNAALLGPVTEFSLLGNPERYADIALAMGEDVEGLTPMEAAMVAAETINELVSDVQIPSLGELGVEESKLEELAPKMAEAAIASGSPGNNPRQATKKEIIELYKIVYKSG